MRPSLLTRRSLDARRLVVGIALVVIALVLLAYWAWQASLRRHEVALDLLRSHAELAAQRLGARIQNELYVGAMAIFRPVLDSARVRATTTVDPQAILRAATAAQECDCVPLMRPGYALRTDLTSAGTEFHGPASPSANEQETVLAALREQLTRMPTGWEVAVLRTQQAIDGRVLLFTKRRRPDGTLEYLAFATDSATLREFVIRPLICNTPLVVAGNRTTGVPNDSLVSVRVAATEDRDVYRGTTRIDVPIASTIRFPVEWGELAVTASLRPRAAELVLPGGVPRSPIPTLLALVATAATLVGIAVVLMWRVHELTRLRADFTSSVSHELRTPLTQILLYAETIEMGRDRSRAKRTEAIGVITRETRRLIHLVENVLQFSRAERSLTRLQLRAQEVGAIVGETVEAFAPVAESRGTSVVLHLAGPVYARVDAEAMRRVLLNLLDNAVRYGPAGQTVTVAVQADGPYARIVVDDEGPGISDDRREAIWQPFVRGEDVPESPTTGCGIGLAIVSELVALHGGRRRVHARPGGGASFVIEVPSAPEPADSSDAGASMSSSGRSPLGSGIR